MSAEPETLSAVLAKMRAAAKSTDLFNGDEVGEPLIRGSKVEDFADRIDAAVQRMAANLCEQCVHRRAATISLKDALELANTIANSGVSANDLGDKAAAAIYALVYEVRTTRAEDGAIKREVQLLRRAPGNAAMREALVEILDRTNREKARDYDAALNGGILEIHDIANTALNQERAAGALEWENICAACAEGTPPERCAYYGDPNGCNAPTIGKHPEGDLAERLQEALEKAERRIAELERATGNAAAMRAALEFVRDTVLVGWRFPEARERVVAALSATTRNCDRFATERDAWEFYIAHTPDNGNIIDGFPPWLFATEAVYGDAAPAEGGEE